MFALASCTNPLLKEQSASVAPPSVSPAGGVFGTDQSVTLSDATSGATIYYTTDGSTPTSSSTQYGGAIAVAGNGTSETINAIAVAGGTTSGVVSAAFTINYSIGGTATLASPSFSPSAGTYTAAPSGGVTLGGPSGASVYYTTDGTMPSASNGTLYTGPISLSNTDGTTTTLRAISVESGVISSPVVTATYAINFDQVSTPQLSVTGGVYTADQTGIAVTVPSAPSGTTIYYSEVTGTVGSTPTNVYSGPLSVTGNGATETIEVMASAPGYTNSTVASATYVINYPQLSAPTFSPTPGIYFGDQTGITISVPSAPSGTAIYYTQAAGYVGSTPTATTTDAYSSALSATGSGNVSPFEAMATAPGYTQSAVTVVEFAISPPTIAFTSSGIFTVPYDATQIVVKLWGGGGAGGDSSGGAGGGGGYATQTLAVTGGQQFNVTVGGAGHLVDTCSAYSSAPGNGGGMSAIGDASGYYAIAGGGGGGALSYSGGAGGAGGLPGSNGSTGSASPGGGGGSNGTGTAPVSGGTGGAGGGGVSYGYSGGPLNGGPGGGYTWGGWGGQGYGGGGGGNSGFAGGGGGGNYGSSYSLGSGQTPGNSGDPDLPAGDAAGGNGGSSACSDTATVGGPGFVYIQVK